MRLPLAEAQDIICDAFDARGKKRVELVRRALSISRDCADAYVILAEEAMPDKNEALRLLEEGVRARFMLGLQLHFMGERSRAIDVFTDLLGLNPNDKPGGQVRTGDLPAGTG